jgi:chromosome segregation ATPase
VGPPGIEEADAEIVALRRELFAAQAESSRRKSELESQKLVQHRLECAVDDLNVQCRFWRQCAEHAVTGWNKLEDEHEAMKDTLRELARALGMTPIVDDAPEAG